MLRLAPPTSGGRWLGVWYGSTALGYWMAGRIGGLWDSVPHALFFAGMVVLALGGLAIGVALNRARVSAGAQA